MGHFEDRYVLSQSFRDDVSRLRIVRGHAADGFLKNLEQARLVIPELCIRYPDTDSRRWVAGCPPNVDVLTLDVEPDGSRLDAAADLETALHRRQHQHVVT
jgi:hypothetical protein